MDLKCRNLDCKNNNCYSCMKKGIDITSHSYCNNYEKSDNLNKKQQQNVPEEMFDKKPEIHPYRHNKTVDIHCKANCLFNHDGKCLANGIAVQNLSQDSAKCVTYMKP